VGSILIIWRWGGGGRHSEGSGQKIDGGNENWDLCNPPGGRACRIDTEERGTQHVLGKQIVNGVVEWSAPFPGESSQKYRQKLRKSEKKKKESNNNNGGKKISYLQTSLALRKAGAWGGKNCVTGGKKNLAHLQNGKKPKFDGKKKLEIPSLGRF